MWGDNPMHCQSHPCGPMIQSLQVQLPDGTISGKIKRNLPPIINTDIGLQQLARYIHYSEEQMKFIDWANYHIASNFFTSTAFSRAHAFKSFNNQQYTDAQAHKFNNNISPTCRCCQPNKSEIIAHIIGCQPRAQTHNEYRPPGNANFRACRIGDNLLKALEPGMDMIKSDAESHQGENWRSNTEGSEIEQKVATFVDDDTVSEQVKDAFSSQVLLGWEGTFQGRFSIRWAYISTPDNKKWIPGYIKILMHWNRACWSNRHQKLFGSRKDCYSFQCH